MLILSSDGCPLMADDPRARRAGRTRGAWRWWDWRTSTPSTRSSRTRSASSVQYARAT